MYRFYECGLIDKDKSRIPAITKILNPCGNSSSKDVDDKLINNFPLLYKTMLEQGHISDEVFDSLGFSKDTDVHGNEISRYAEISQESYQRSKQLTHKYQVNLRQAHVDQIMAQQCQSEESAANKELFNLM